MKIFVCLIFIVINAPTSFAATTSAKMPTSLRDQAASELKLAPADVSGTVMPTPATVRSRVEAVKSPIAPLAYRLGVSLQPLTPEGTMSVAGSAPYELSVLGSRPMVALEGQWLPLTFERIPRARFGAYASLGYAQHTMDLKSPSGAAMENTQVHSTKMQTGLSSSWQLPRDSKWSLNGQLGLGRWNTVQSSTSSYANQSTSLSYSALGANVERSFFEGLSGYAGYEYRSVVRADADGATLPRDNFMVGFLGHFE
ncbi:MAG: hypothetical protein AAB250_19875 [Bdellovibrionota bacterium]|mgnify:CR=1 FL=1